MCNHLTAVLPIYNCLLVKLQSLFGIIKVEINGRENEKRSFGLLLRYFPIGE